MDVTMLSGEGWLANSLEEADRIPLGAATRYAYTRPAFEPTRPEGLDVDLDREADQVEFNDDGEVEVTVDPPAGEGETDNSGGEGDNPEQEDETDPDFTRLADTAPDFEDRGLLETISEADLKDTDLYVFREANGQLLSEQRRLGRETAEGEDKPDEHVPYYNIDVDGEEVRFFYTLLIRGPRFQDHLAGKIEPYQEKTGTPEELRGLRADHLRVGEAITLIAINRPTGYIGTVSATVEPAQNGRLDFPLDKLVLRPPNLKIRAERVYEVEAGLTEGEEREYLIGFEGAGLTSDQYIAVYTDWLDHDGTPLPEDLDGYTGRLAKTVGPNQLAGVQGQISHFEIKPGSRTQLIRLPDDTPLSMEHYYIHVNGEPKDRNPSFAEIGAGEGILQYRPSRYVPIRVAVFDEAETRRLRNETRYAHQDELTDLTGADIDPVYRWPHRPEMQFSVMDLEVERLTRIDATLPDGEQIYELGEDDPVAQIGLGDDRLDILYNLFQQTYGLDELPILDALGPNRELIFAVGEQEIEVTLGEDQSLQFENLAHLALLQPEDFLTLSLYQNTDPENVLWEWAFALSPIAIPEAVEISADEASQEFLVYLPGGIDRQDNPDATVTFQWRVEGPSGTLAESQTVSESGLLTNTLETSRTAGDEYYVTGRIIQSDDAKFEVGTELRFGPFTVVPGQPARIDGFSPPATAPADGTTITDLSAHIQDAYGNAVADGTPVSWVVEGDGEVAEDSVFESSNGWVSAKLQSGVIPETVTLTLRVEEALSEDRQLTQEPIALDVESTGQSITTASNETITFTATADNAADGTPVSWLSTRGEISGDATLQNGTATATLNAAPTPGEGHVLVSVAGEKASRVINHVGGQPFSARFEHAAIVGDETSDGQTLIEQADGGTKSYDYVAGTALTLSGAPGETIRLNLGSPIQPNAEPVVHLPLQNVVGGETLSIDGGSSAMIFGNPQTGNGGLQFDGSDYLLLNSTPETQLTDQVYAHLAFELASADATGTLIRQGTEIDYAYKLEVTQASGVPQVRLSIRTENGTETLAHPHVLQVGRVYRVGLRYHRGLMELQLRSQAVAASQEIATRPVTGALVDTEQDIVVGDRFVGTLGSLQLGSEAADRLLTAFENGQATVDLTFDQSGNAAADLRSLGRMQGLGRQVGVMYASLDPTAKRRDYQPVQFAGLGEAARWLGNVLLSEARAELASELRYPSGVAVVGKETSGWFSSLAEKLDRITEEAVDVLKTGGQLVSIIVGIDDFIVLTETLIALSFGATADIDYVDVAFAGVGAILSVSAIASAGSLAPAVAPLKLGLQGFKAAIKSLGPDGVRAGFVMAKGLGETLKLFFRELRQNPQVALALIEDIGRSLAHLAGAISRPILGIFVRTMRAPADFLNWVRSSKLFNRSCAQGLASAGPRRGRTWQFALAATASLMIAPAQAAPTPCELVFEEGYELGNAVLEASLQGERLEEARQGLNAIGALLEAELREEFPDLVLRSDAVEGFAQMLVYGKSERNAVFLVRNVVREGFKNGAGPLKTIDETNEVINKYFRMIRNLKDLPVETVQKRFAGDLGYFRRVNQGRAIYGQFHVLEFLDDLMQAGFDLSAAKLERFARLADETGPKGPRRYFDLQIPGDPLPDEIPRRFELKNLTQYHIYENVSKQFSRDLADILTTESSVPEVLRRLRSLHIVFRGFPDKALGARRMLEGLRKQADELIEASAFKTDRRIVEIKDFLDQAILQAPVKLVPDPGDLIVFQGKKVPYGIE